MNQQPCAFDVAEETDAEARAQMCPFDQAGKISHDKSASELRAVPAGAAVGINDAEVGFELGERIVRNLGALCGNHVNQRRLADVGKTTQANIVEKFPFQ